MEELTLFDFVPSATTIVGLVVVLFVVHKVIVRITPEHNRRFRSQVVMAILINVGLLIVLLVIPIKDTTRGQLLSLIGIVVSAAIALSSTTFLGQAMAGIMLKSVRNFHTGDFIQVADHFGRVTERGLFHTEIQTETRDLTTLPNLFMVTQPLTTIRQSGTIVSTTCSLGYDVPRTKIESLLLQAAEDCGLQEGFVHITNLGDFSVSYRVSGLLVEVKQLISTRAKLRAAVLDRLHEGGIEIVSPNFMNQRVLPEDKVFIPRRVRKTPADDLNASTPEALVFDKADEAESLEALRKERDAMKEQIDEAEEAAKKVEGADADAIKQGIERLEADRQRLDALIQQREAQKDADD